MALPQWTQNLFVVIAEENLTKRATIPQQTLYAAGCDAKKQGVLRRGLTHATAFGWRRLRMTVSMGESSAANA